MKLSEARKATSEAVGGPPILAACMVCKTPTEGSTLSAYGARCYGCFRAYCDGKPIGRRNAAHQALDALKDGQDVPSAEVNAALRATGDVPAWHDEVQT